MSDTIGKMIEELVKLAGHMAWPLLALVVVYLFRTQLCTFIERISERVGDPSSEISLGGGKLEIKSRTDAAFGIIDSLRADVESLKEKALGKAAVDTVLTSKALEHPSAQNPIDDTLNRLADGYLGITASDWNERVRIKNSAANSMGDYVITNRVSRDLLAKQNNEGLILALANAVHSFPEKGDLDRLFFVKDKVTRPHVKYWILMAVGRIFELGMATTEDAEQALEMLRLFAMEADSSLKKRINQTRSIIQITKPRQ
jgi:hypothetical protein